MTKQVATTETERKEIVMSSPEDVLSYWFPEDDIFDADQETFGRQMQWWFQGGPEVDRQITERFAQVLEQARRGELDHWADTPRGRRTDRRAGPVLAHRLPRLAPLLLT